ncbi:hypothetical protein ABZ318_29705 [Streptomyces sp. NPDC006197]|uniref:hypothetical protein n=1 Tax=Streptomyces sp. NPDC006197 TaxID=3156685 RepID=UPI0033B14BAB
MALPGRREPYGSAEHEGGDAPWPTGPGARLPYADTAEAAAGIARLEGYLLAHRVRSEAAEAGAAFARRFPWLGPREEAEVARVFEQEHRAVRHRMLQATAARAEELRREYGHRYACLRRRLVATFLCLVGGMTVVLGVVVRGAG